MRMPKFEINIDCDDIVYMRNFVSPGTSVELDDFREALSEAGYIMIKPSEINNIIKILDNL